MKDIVLDDFIITITGNYQVLIENYKGIQSYDSTGVCIMGNKKKLFVVGLQLSIQYYSYEAMKISGFIEKIEFQ